MNVRSVVRMIGLLLVVEAGFMTTSIGWAIRDGDVDSLQHFIIASLITGLAGSVCFVVGRSAPTMIRARDALATVGIGWLLVGAFGAIPYLLEGALTHPADAFFESASGFTTTGATVIPDVEILSRSLLWWRSLTQWMGGVGIVVLFIAVFPHLGVGASHLFRSETTGPITERLRPKLRHTSRLLWYIYVGLTGACATLLIVAGMEPFDAICHAFTTLATGGFSTKNASIAAYSSISIELIILLFMFLAGINFGLYYRAASGQPGELWRDAEFRTYTAVVVVATVLVTAAILPQKETLGHALRYSVFQVVSLQTATGHASDDFDRYPEFARLLLLSLMFVGGSAGSTAGGIKVIRILVLGRALVNQLVKSFQPSAVLAVRVGQAALDSGTVKSISVFFAAFLGVFLFGTLLLTMMGLDIISAASAAVACQSNVGPGLGTVGPTKNFAAVPHAGKMILSFMMIAGRLEIMTVLALLVPAFWRR
jgi:trk system potassium uptake protein TrkH